MFYRSIVLLASIVIIPAGPALAEGVAWQGTGRYRILLEVDPVALNGRPSDELVSLFDFDLQALGPVVPQDRSLDLESLQVMRYLPQTGRAERYTNNAYPIGEHDRPFQFYDATYPDEFPEYTGYISLDHLHGRPLFRSQPIPFGARHFNAVGQGRKGKLAWPHTQEGNERLALRGLLRPAPRRPGASGGAGGFRRRRLQPPREGESVPGAAGQREGTGCRLG